MILSLGDVHPEISDDQVFVAPGASVIGDVELHARSSIWFSAVVRGDIDRIVVGEDSNIQDCSILHTDAGFPLKIGRRVTVGHMVMLHGCEVGDNSLIGIGTTILNGAKIGANCIVGAHSLVTEGKEFPDGVLLLGAPAKVARDLTEQELAELPEHALRYSARAKRYLDEMQAAD